MGLHFSEDPRQSGKESVHAGKNISLSGSKEEGRD
jgi:hypothetical protein